MKRLHGFTLIEVVAVMFVITALAIVAVPVGRNVLTQYREREFMEALVEEWEMLKMRARAEPSSGNMYVNGEKREVRFVTQGKTKILAFPESLAFGGESRMECNPNGKIVTAGSLYFRHFKDITWKISFQLGWGRAILTKIKWCVVSRTSCGFGRGSHGCGLVGVIDEDLSASCHTCPTRNHCLLCRSRCFNAGACAWWGNSG